MGTRSSIGSVSLLYALSVFFHRVAVYSYTRRSYSSFPLSLSSLLRLVCSSLSPCMRVFASLAARRQRSAATARTTSFILSSLPAMPRVTREPVAVAVCSPRWSDGEGYRMEGGGWGREGKGRERDVMGNGEKEREGRNAASLEFCAALRVSMAGNMGIIGGMLFETVARLLLFLLSLRLYLLPPPPAPRPPPRSPLLPPPPLLRSSRRL